MKLKGVNPIAQHIEKIVLGVTVVVFLAVISLQFVSQPNKVKVGNREVSPDQIYNELASTATTLQSQITDRSPALPEVAPVNLVERYNQAFDAASQTTTSLDQPLGQGIDIASLLRVEISTDAGGDVGPIEAMPVPPTSKPLATSSWATLDPYAVAQLPAYTQFVPAVQPFDFPSVSIEVDFSGTTLRDVLEGNEGYPGVPRLFWVSTGMAVMGLEAERQQLRPDGSWSSSQPITTPPGTPLPTNAVSQDDGLVRLNEIIKNAQAVAPEVMRPMFPPTISGPAWQPPSDLADAGSSGLTEVEQVQRQLARLTAEVDRLKNPPRRTASTTTTSSSTSGRASSRSRDPGPGTSSGGRTTNTDANKKKIERLETQIETIQATLKRLGVEADLATTTTQDILDQDYIQLWAHDLGVQPGATYRYRTRAVLNNPYFRKGPYLDETSESQQALTVNPFARGEWSEWSEPVAVGAKEFFFVTEASQPVVGADLPQARVELYSMYYGYYRRSSMTLTPGEGLAADIRVSGTLFTLDTDLINADNAAGYIDDLIAGRADTARPDGLTPAPDRLSVNLNTYMIQVIPDPLVQPTPQDAQGLRLTFRLSDGTLVSRTPSSDRNSPLYNQAQSSAALASRAQLRPTGQPAQSEAAALFLPVEP